MLRSSSKSFSQLPGLMRVKSGCCQVAFQPLSPLIGQAGPSRLPAPASPTRCISYSRKGKERAVDDRTLTIHYGTLCAFSQAKMTCLNSTQRRHFHASARRQAIPLIPATIGILKTTSVLTAVTALSRILISFFPIGTLATFKMSRGVRWLASEDQKPDVGKEAFEFWQMWCEGEKGIRPSTEEAKEILQGTSLPHGGLTSADGRVSYPTPHPPGRFGQKREDSYVMDPSALAKNNVCGKGEYSRLIHLVKRTRFFFPPLPPASLPYYQALSPKSQVEVDSLRRYWISLRMFKDNLKLTRIVMMTLLFLPFFLVFGVYVAGLERVPLTGRWRIILLTPEEEDTISSSLAGANWYRSVITLLTTEEKPAPPIVPYEDWRWRWVEGVLRRLESAALAECQGRPPPFGPSAIPIPPARYPFKPRPRVSSMLHSCLSGTDSKSGQEHLEIGPPYSLMIMEKDDENAFSYGFGGKGAGGIVIYTGLLDSILRQGAPESVKVPAVPSGFFSSLFSTAPPRPVQSMPTETQTLHLACVLAHEMGHLLLSHHLETLSQQQVLWPSMLGLSVDLTRAFIWPLTFFLGPTVNDALANIGRTSTDEMSERYGQIGFQWKHEYEADLAGLRILALAGFDPKAAVDHFSESVAALHEIQPVEERDQTLTGRFFKLWTWATHPTSEQRTEAIKAEMDRWVEEAKEDA